MKPFSLILVFLCFGLTAFGQQPEYPDSGFTNKAEAKNLLVNGKKEGKWVEYLYDDDTITTNTNAPFYRLTIYKTGKMNGLTRVYFKSGELAEMVDYINGKANGALTDYLKNRNIWHQAQYVNGQNTGIEKYFYSNGMLEEMITYNSNLGKDSIKRYDDKGNEISHFPHRFTMVPFINTLWQSSLYLQLDIAHPYGMINSDNNLLKFIDAFSKLGVVYYPYSKQTLWAPEFSSEVNSTIFSLRGTIAYYMQSGRGSFYFTPEVGLTIVGGVTLGCGYNIPVTQNEFTEIKHLQIFATCVIPPVINSKVENIDYLK